jgi:hypothetical protein
LTNASDYACPSLDTRTARRDRVNACDDRRAQRYCLAVEASRTRWNLNFADCCDLSSEEWTKLLTEVIASVQEFLSVKSIESNSASLNRTRRLSIFVSQRSRPKIVSAPDHVEGRLFGIRP